MIIQSVPYPAGGGGGTPTASPHRYWRLYMTSFESTAGVSGPPAGALVIAEIELREVVGGADVTGSGTASSSTTFSGAHAAANAFANDGQTSIWASGGSELPEWIAYDFGAGNDKAILEVAIQPNTGQTGVAPGKFKVQYSDDGTNWIDSWWIAHAAVSAHGFTAGSFTVFTKPAVEQNVVANRHRYWRLGITGSNGGSFVGALDIQFRVVANSTDDTQGGTAASTSNFGGLPPSGAFSEPPSAAQWASNNVGFPENIQYDFGAGREKAITEVYYHPRNGLFGSQAPTGFTIEYSDNGSSWTVARTVTGITWVASPQTWTVP